MATKVFKLHPLQQLFLLALPIGVLGLNLFFQPRGIAGVESLTEHSIFLCPLHWLTDLLCPGCGMTRSLVAFFSGQLSLSFYFNPWGVMLGFVLVILWFRTLLGQSLSVHSPSLQRWAPLLTVVLVAWGILRNL